LLEIINSDSSGLSDEEKWQLKKLLIQIEGINIDKEKAAALVEKELQRKMKFIGSLQEYQLEKKGKDSKLDADLEQAIRQLHDHTDEQRVLIQLHKEKLRQEEMLNTRMQERNKKRLKKKEAIHAK
jgi:hypothetical protein